MSVIHSPKIMVLMATSSYSLAFVLSPVSAGSLPPTAELGGFQQTAVERLLADTTLPGATGLA